MHHIKTLAQATIKSLFWGLSLAAIVIPVMAQQSGPTLNLVHEWKQKDQMWRGYMAISPDGTYVAHPVGQSLFIQNIKTGEDTHFMDNASGPSFSPDGKRLVFTLGNIPSQVYTAKIDESDLMRLAPSVAEDKNKWPSWTQGNPSRSASPCKGNSSCTSVQSVETLPASSSFSPDGSKLIVLVRTAKRDKDGYIDQDTVKQSIAIISAHQTNQEPKPLVNNRLFSKEIFWNQDSKAIFYAAEKPNCNEGMCVRLYKLNIATNENTEIKRPFEGPVDKLPGANAIFEPKDGSVKIVNIDANSNTSTVDPALAKIAAAIPSEDSEGRSLIEIQGAVKSKRLLLIYSGAAGGGPHPWGDDFGHAELVSYQ